jgi:hypothetical protein
MVELDGARRRAALLEDLLGTQAGGEILLAPTAAPDCRSRGDESDGDEPEYPA